MVSQVSIRILFHQRLEEDPMQLRPGLHETGSINLAVRIDRTCGAGA